jgi:hypothetical protein
LLALCTLLLACRSEEERRAWRMARLRADAENGMAAAHRYCVERDSVLARFQRREPGWERALEEVLRASLVLEDHCIEASRPHEHGEAPIEGDPADHPPDTLRGPR